MAHIPKTSHAAVLVQRPAFAASSPARTEADASPQRATPPPVPPGVAVSDEVRRVFSFSLRPVVRAQGAFDAATAELEAAMQGLAKAQPEGSPEPWRGAKGAPSQALQAARARLAQARVSADDARAALGETRADLRRLALGQCGQSDPTLRTLTDRIDAAANASASAKQALAILQSLKPSLESGKSLSQGDVETLGFFRLAVEALNDSLQKVSPSIAPVGELGLENEAPGASGPITPAVMKGLLEGAKATVDATRLSDLTLRDARATLIATSLEATVTPQPEGPAKRK